MSKDPAFLFYPKDWVSDTAEMSPEAKGIYIDLLCHQHQNGDLPTDFKRLSRITRISEQQMEELWPELEPKFERTVEQSLERSHKRSLERMYNRKLQQVTNDRLTKSKQNKIIGIFSSIIRKDENLDKKTEKAIKQMFDVHSFSDRYNDRLYDRLYEWYQNAKQSIGDANVNGNGNVNKEEDYKEEKMGVTFPWDSDVFKKYWYYWKEYKRKDHKFQYKTSISEQAALKKLSELAEGDEQAALKIIENSISNGWKGFFPLDKKGKSQGSDLSEYKQKLQDIINEQ